MHPATKQLDGRMQIQALPSSLTVVPVFMASGHTTKTSAMPSSSTLHYAAKQLDDTVINNRTQPLDRQLNTSPPAKQLDGNSWFKSWQLTPPQQSLLRSNCNMPTHAGRHVRTIANRPPCSRTPPGQLSNPEDECTHTSFPRAKIPPLTLICNANHTLQHNFGKEWPKTFSAARHYEDASSSSAERTTTLRLEISTEQSHPVQDDPVNEGQLINGLVLGSFKHLFVKIRFYAGSIHDSDDVIKAVQGLHVVIYEEGPSTCGLPEEPEVGNCSPTKPSMTVDFPAPFAPMTATRLTSDTVRFTSTIVGLFSWNTETLRVMRSTTLLRLFTPQGDQAPGRRTSSSYAQLAVRPFSPRTSPRTW